MNIFVGPEEGVKKNKEKKKYKRMELDCPLGELGERFS